MTVDIRAKLRAAVTAHQQGRLDLAYAAYEEILRLHPRQFDALHLLGVIALQRKEAQKSVALIRQAIEVNPDHAAAHMNLGSAFRELRQLDQALASYDRAIALRPDFADAHSNRGNALRELGRLEHAVASCDRAIGLMPDLAEAHSNRGNALRDLGRAEEALASCDRAVALMPDLAEAHCNRANALVDLRRMDEALTAYERAIAMRPDFANAHLNEGFCRLLMGDFERGLKKYEWRWQLDPRSPARRNFRQPLWLGSEPLAGKAVLLHAEQGLGDTIQFCRYARLVAERGARVLLEVQSEVRPLLNDLEGVSGIYTKGESLAPFDYHCPLLTLPLAFNTRLETIPAEVPYLFSDPEKKARWQARLGDKMSPRIGLVWSGSARHDDDRNRSLPLARLIQAIPPQMQLYSLQKVVREADHPLLRSRPDFAHFGDELQDFSDTAAIASQMDLVISADTSVAHLAGALGKPVWILLPFAPDWRWLLNRSDSPWYPTARLFRQPAPGSWDDVLYNVTTALAGRLARI